jgi:hypothetical protein
MVMDVDFMRERNAVNLLFLSGNTLQRIQGRQREIIIFKVVERGYCFNHAQHSWFHLS